MVAPAGVNEGIPQEPVKAGAASIEVADAQATEAEPAEAVHAEPAPAQAVPRPAEPVEGKADPAEADHADAEPAVVDSAEAEAKQGEAEQAEAEQAEQAEAEPTDSEHLESEQAEAGPGELDWDAEVQGRDVSPLAVAGIILVIIALVGVAVGVLAVVTHGFRPKTVVTYRPAAVFGLRPGECINSGSNVLSVTVVSCATPHDAEVFATFSLPKMSWPGASAVQQAAGDGCQSRFGGYLNPQLATADLAQEYVYPNQDAWQAGERTVVCEVRADSGSLTGSVRAPG